MIAPRVNLTTPNEIARIARNNANNVFKVIQTALFASLIGQSCQSVAAQLITSMIIKILHARFAITRVIIVKSKDASIVLEIVLFLELYVSLLRMVSLIQIQRIAQVKKIFINYRLRYCCYEGIFLKGSKFN